MTAQTNSLSKIHIFDNYLEIINLKFESSEVIDYFSNFRVSELDTQAIKALEIGVSVLSRLQQSQNIDFIEARLSDMMLKVQDHFHIFDEQMRGLLEANLNPSQAGSFLNVAHTLIAAEAGRVNASLSQALKDTRESIATETQKLSLSREQFDTKLDPNNSAGYLAALIKRVEDFENKLNSQFSTTDSASFVGKLNTLVEQHFGRDGEVLSLIEKKMSIDPTNPNQTPLGQVYTSLKSDIASLRDAVMKMVGQQEIVDSTTKKGYPFEDQVFEELQRIAHPFGDIVEDTSLKAEAISGSKKGDYVYRLANTDVSLVLDAKNYGKLKSLPAMIAYIRDAMRDRGSKMGVIVVPDKSSLQKQIGSWNVYDKCIITPIDYLEITIKYAKFVLQLEDAGDNAINSGLIRQKLEAVQRKMKEMASVKSKLTKLSNGVSASITDIQSNLDGIRNDVIEKLIEIDSELQKS